MFCEAHDVRGILFDPFRIFFFNDDLGHPQDPMHGVVDFMGHTGDQRAEAGQLFSLNQPILKLFLFRDLPDDNPGLLLFAVAAVYREEAILVHALL